MRKILKSYIAILNLNVWTIINLVLILFKEIFYFHLKAQQ